jgi:hypothetical protein
MSIQNNKLDAIILNLFLDLVESLVVHLSSAISNQDNPSLVLELLGIGVDHLNGNDNGRDS